MRVILRLWVQGIHAHKVGNMYEMFHGVHARDYVLAELGDLLTYVL